MLPRFVTRTALALALTVLAGTGRRRRSIRARRCSSAGLGSAERRPGAAAAEAFRERARRPIRRTPRLHLGGMAAPRSSAATQDAKDALERAIALDAASRRRGRCSDRFSYRHRRFRRRDPHLRGLVALAADQPPTRDGRPLERWRRRARACTSGCSRRSARTSRCSFEGPSEAALAARGARRPRPRLPAHRRLLLGGTYPNEPVPVVLYTGEQFRDITRSPDPSRRRLTTASIRVPMRGRSTTRRNWNACSAHEFTHALVRSARAARRAGVAERGARDRARSGRSEVGRDAGPGAGAGAAADAAQSGFGRLTGDAAQLAYATSALTVPPLSSTKPAASRSPTCCATSATAPISRPRSCTASSGRSPNSGRRSARKFRAFDILFACLTASAS